MAIVSILMTIALPGFETIRRKSERGEIKSLLLRLAHTQELYYLRNSTYTADVAELSAPEQAVELSYDLSISADPCGDLSKCFTATADAKGRQADDHPCQHLMVDSFGARFATDSKGQRSSNCW